MARENFRKTKHKYPKFRDSYDENLDWQDKQELRDLQRKNNSRSQRRRDGFEKW